MLYQEMPFDIDALIDKKSDRKLCRTTYLTIASIVHLLFFFNLLSVTCVLYQRNSTRNLRARTSVFITAKLGTAVVVVKGQVNRYSQFLGSPQKTIGAITIKSGTNDYVGKWNPRQNLATLRLLHHTVEIPFGVLSITILIFFNVMLIFDHGYR